MPVVRPMPKPLPITVTQVNNYGIKEVVSTSKVVIKESKEIQTVVQEVYHQKPQLAVLKPISVKNVQYGDLEESTIVFGGVKKSTVQVTSIVNKKTKEVKIISEKLIPVIYRPEVEIKPIIPIRYIPIPFLKTIQKKMTELVEITSMI